MGRCGVDSEDYLDGVLGDQLCDDLFMGLVTDSEVFAYDVELIPSPIPRSWR